MKTDEAMREFLMKVLREVLDFFWFMGVRGSCLVSLDGEYRKKGTGFVRRKGWEDFGLRAKARIGGSAAALGRRYLTWIGSRSSSRR